MITLYPIEGFREGFVLEGHANYAEHGKDIVCSAVSALAQSVYLTINKYHITSSIQKSGFLAITFLPTQDTQCFVEVLLVGVKQLSHQYPDYITISEKEYELDEKDTWI